MKNDKLKSLANKLNKLDSKNGDIELIEKMSHIKGGKKQPIIDDSCTGFECPKAFDCGWF